MKSAERDPPSGRRSSFLSKKEGPYKRGAKLLAAMTSPYVWLMGAARLDNCYILHCHSAKSNQPTLMLKITRYSYS